MNDVSRSHMQPGAFTHTIRVRWADCDPARIVFTGRIPFFALEAIEAWWESKVGVDWYTMNIDRDVGAPFVHMTMDFRRPVTPRHLLICEVWLIRLGESSVRFSVRGQQDGETCFEGKFVEAFVAAAAHCKQAASPDFRAILEPLVTG